MEAASPQTIATFTGTLLRREHTPGQKFVQLVFREDGQNWLCVSSNLVYNKLVTGQTYHIQGVYKQAGDRSFISEPIIKLAKRSAAPRTTRRRKPALIAASITSGVLLVSGVVFALHGHASNDLQAATTASHTPVSVVTDTATNTVDTQPSTDPVATTPPTTPTTPTTVATTTKKTATTTPPPPVTTPTPPVSTAYCDDPTVVDVTYTPVPITDGSYVDGATIDPGTPGSEQKCYDDSTGSNPHIVPVTAMVPGTKASVPPPAP